MDVVAYLFIGLFALTTTFAFFQIYRAGKMKDQKAQLEAKLLTLESAFAELKTQRTDKPAKQAKVQAAKAQQAKADDSSAKELVELRKTTARQKDEISRLRAEVKGKDQEQKDRFESLQGRLDMAAEENKKLLELLREQDSRMSQRDKTREEASTAERETLRKERDQARRELSAAQQKLAESERTTEGHAESTKALREKLAAAQNDLRRWQQLNTLANGKELTPELFVRWHNRAQAGREMYRLMKQLRELSDEKLYLYQQGIVRLSQFVLATLQQPQPSINPGDVRADRLFGAALAALHEQGMISAPEQEATELRELTASESNAEPAQL